MGYRHIPVIVRPSDPSATLRGRKWALFSFEHPDGTLYPVARMKRRPRVQGSRDGESTITFDAGLLSNWKDLRDQGLAALKRLIGFHPVFVSPRRHNDPMEILDGHRRIGHFNRVTGAYTTPELLGEGLPMRTFRPDDWIGWSNGGGINVSEAGQALRGVQVTCTASWMQLLQGMLDLSAAIRPLFPELNVGPASDPKSLFGGYDPSVVIASGRVATLTPDEFERGFPQAGASIAGGSGYTVVKSVVTKVDPKRFAEGPQPKSVGSVHGTKGKHVYVRKEGEPKPDPADAYAVNLDVTYYDVELVLAYVAQQKREETVSFLVLNATCSDPDAPIKTLDMRTEDPSIDQTTVPWLPRTHYVPADVRRVGWNCWLCAKEHVSASFAGDVQAGRWTLALALALANQSYTGGAGGRTFWHLPSGINALFTVVLKATKMLALAQRRNPYEFSVPFEDIVADGFSTAWKARIEADNLDLPGGRAEGKVVSLTVRDEAGPGGLCQGDDPDRGLRRGRARQRHWLPHRGLHGPGLGPRLDRQVRGLPAFAGAGRGRGGVPGELRRGPDPLRPGGRLPARRRGPVRRLGQRSRTAAPEGADEDHLRHGVEAASTRRFRADAAR